MDRLAFRVRLSLLPTEAGGRKSPIANDYRPSWDLGNTWLGKPTLNDGRVLMDGSLAPGAAGPALLQPLAPEFWSKVRAGMVIPMLEGARLVGHATILGDASRPEHLSPEVLSFVQHARQYCESIAGAGELPFSGRCTGPVTPLHRGASHERPCHPEFGLRDASAVLLHRRCHHMKHVQNEPIVLGTVVAEREYRSGRRKVVVQIGTPRRASWKTDFQCPIRFVVAGKTTLEAAYGVDSVQALMLAFDVVGAVLDVMSPPVRWIGSSRPGDTGIYKRIPMSFSAPRSKRGRSGTR